MKVLIWTDSNAFSGTERHCLDLATKMRQSGVSVKVSCRKKSPLLEAVVRHGLEVLELNALNAPFSSFRTLCCLLRNREVDLIHSHNGRTNLIACLAVAWTGRGRVVATQHFICPARVRRRGFMRVVSRWLHGLVDSHVARWIAVSDAVAKAMVVRGDASAGRIRTVWHGTPPPASGEPERSEARAELGLPMQTPILICVARLVPEKGVEVFLRACSMLRNEGLTFFTVIVGDGELRQELEDLACKWGLSDCLRWAGHQLRPEIWMRASDLLVLPSTEEPFGLVLLEAMSRGVPVLAAASGGPMEIITPNCGAFFHPGDARDLAEKLLGVLPNVRREELGRGAISRWKERFQLGTMAEKTLAIYREALGLEERHREEFVSG